MRKLTYREIIDLTLQVKDPLVTCTQDYPSKVSTLYCPSRCVIASSGLLQHLQIVLSGVIYFYEYMKKILSILLSKITHAKKTVKQYLK